MNSEGDHEAANEDDPENPGDMGHNGYHCISGEDGRR